MVPWNLVHIGFRGLESIGIVSFYVRLKQGFSSHLDFIIGLLLLAYHIDESLAAILNL